MMIRLTLPTLVVATAALLAFSTPALAQTPAKQAGASQPSVSTEKTQDELDFEADLLKTLDTLSDEELETTQKELTRLNAGAASPAVSTTPPAQPATPPAPTTPPKRPSSWSDILNPPTAPAAPPANN